MNMSKEVTYEKESEKFIKISSTGNIDFEITLVLSEQEAELFQVFPDKIETITDCEHFLRPINLEIDQMTFKTEQFKKANIYDYIRLSSENSTINSLLVINRAFKKKAFIELITMSELKFNDSDEFLKEVIKNITEQNFLFLVENNFLPYIDSKIKFVIKIDNKIVKTFENICLCSEDSKKIQENSEYRSQKGSERNFDEKSEKSKKFKSSINSANKISEKNKSASKNNQNISVHENKTIEKNIAEKTENENNIQDEDNNDENIQNNPINENMDNSYISDRKVQEINEIEQSHEQNKNSQLNNNDFENELNNANANNEIQNFSKNQDNENKSNFNNELDETANKIINSIPNGSSENIINPKNSNLTHGGDELIIKEKIFSNQNENNLIINEENENNLSNQKLNENVNNNEIPNDQKLNQKEAVFDRFKYDFSGSDYFFVDMNEIFNLKKFNFSLSDFYELIKKIADDFKRITIIINFPNIIKYIGFLDLESINVLNEIIGLTDIFIFDKKDALALFNLMAQINSEEDNYEDKKNLEQLFIKEVKKKRKSHPKIGIFLDELKRVTIIEQQSTSNLILFHTDYEFNLTPLNVSKTVAEDYRKLFVVHYDLLKSVFVGGLFSRMLYKKPFNSGFTAGNESLKRVVELLRFNLDSPIDPNFFLIRIKKNNKFLDEEDKFRKKKEQHFILDCSNIVNSKMKEYNPLYDENLISYFSSKFIRKHLKKLGFINKKGSILQDPDNKKLGIIESKKLNKVYEDEKVNLEKIKDKKEKLKLQIKNLLQGNNVMKSGNMKEIEKLAKVYNFYPQSEKKLPSINDYKKSLNKNIKINSELYLREIQKGKGRGKSIQKSPKRTDNFGRSTSKTKKPDNTLLDVIEKIEDKILYNDISGISHNKKENSVSNNNIYLSNSKNNINTSNNNINNQSTSKKQNTKSGKSHISELSMKQDQENSRIRSSSLNKVNVDEVNTDKIENRSFENQNMSRNNNILESKISNEAEDNVISDKNKSNIEENNEIEIKKEAEGDEINKSLDKLNLDNSKIEKNLEVEDINNSGLENNVNISKISKKNDLSGQDLNISKKSNPVIERNSPKNDNEENNKEVENIEEENPENNQLIPDDN